MKLFEPPIADEAVPFWDASREQRLVLPWCRACERAFWFPRPTCPRCLTDDIEWRPGVGTGTVYAVSVQYKPGPMREEADGPYAVALVDLDDGVRMMTNLIDVEPAAVAVGDRFEIRWHPLSDGRHLPFFAPRTKATNR